MIDTLQFRYVSDILYIEQFSAAKEETFSQSNHRISFDYVIDAKFVIFNA